MGAVKDRGNEVATQSLNQWKTLNRNEPKSTARYSSRGATPADPTMRDIALVTDDDLARARVDFEFRHRLVADNLELLLDELNRLRSCTDTDPTRARQIREGVDLAVQLADLLQRIERHTGR
jgi:hypothetical protein